MLCNHHLLLHNDVQHAPHDAPGIVHVQINLLTKLDGLELLGSQDNVPGAVLDTVPGHIPELEVVGTSENTLNSPLGKFASIVL